MFINLFRNSILSKQEYQLWVQNNPTTEILKATHISFPPNVDKINLTDPSGYSNYDCWTIIFFYANNKLDHPTYLQTCSALDKTQNIEIKSVLFMDRRDLLDYLQGVTDSSLKIKGVVKEKQQQDLQMFGFDLSLKRSQLSQEQRYLSYFSILTLAWSNI